MINSNKDIPPSGGANRSAAAPVPAPVPAPGPGQEFGPRLAAGLSGIFIAAMMAGLNNRVGALALSDLRAHLGWGMDQASWLNTVYVAGEMIAMPFAAWFAVTLSLRRFHLLMLAVCALLAALLPCVRSLEWMLALRGLQGLAGGTLIPLLMMAALRFLPPPIRLHALALYSMTATFAPNIAIWVAGLWMDGLADLRMVYWQVVPVSLLAAVLVAWGIPQDPPRPGRFREGNWLGMLFGVAGLGLLALALDQGNRREWLASPLIAWTLAAGGACTLVYLFSEWRHPAPFIKLQLLGRRNLGLGFMVFVGLLVLFLSGAMLPSVHLGHLWHYRAAQAAPIGLIIGLPQLAIAPAIALLLYQKRVDARHVLAVGLVVLALACWLGSQLRAEWMWREFVWAQALQAIGQPMAVVPLLFLVTSVVQPAEGPYVAGTVNLLRAAGMLLGGALIGRLLQLRERFHTDMLAATPEPAGLAHTVFQQASVLAVADAYRVLAVLALLLIPCVLALQHIPAPRPSSAPSRP
jgi:DHA2 family multidrug resistance protein